MPALTPETLAEVPAFHYHNATEIVRLGSTALGDIATRSYDPATGEYGESLAVVHRDVVDVLDEIYGKTTATVEGTHVAVLGLVSGDTATRYHQSLSSPSLYSAITAIEGAPAEVVAALRAGLDSRVFREALKAPSLYSAKADIYTHASPFGFNLLHLGLERRVYAEAIQAPSLYSATNAIRAHAVHGDALRRGLDARVLREALGAASLYSATDAITSFGSNQAQKSNMRIVLDTRVEDQAQSSPSLYSATNAIRSFGSSTDSRIGMRTRLNDRVEEEALSAPSAYSGLDTARTHGFGERKEEIERKVAQKWLPVERKKLTQLQVSLEETNQKLNDINALNRFKKLIKFPKTRKLKIAAKYYEMRIKNTSATVEELSTILNPEE